MVRLISFGVCATLLARNACFCQLTCCSHCALKMHPEPALTGVDISFKNGRFVRGVSKKWAARKCGAAAWSPRCKKRVCATLPRRNHHFWMHRVSSRHRKRPLHTASKFEFFETPHAEPLLLMFSRAQNKAPATVRHELDVGRRCLIFGFQDDQK